MYVHTSPHSRRINISNTHYINLLFNTKTNVESTPNTQTTATQTKDKEKAKRNKPKANKNNTNTRSRVQAKILKLGFTSMTPKSDL